MARLPILERSRDEHGLKIGAITDLISLPQPHEKLIERIAERPLATQSAHSGSSSIATS
jgi:3,4-dihydroxy 2-butanone 4-phosphate synthase/GTP cyclohydrolase II